MNSDPFEYGEQPRHAPERLQRFFAEILTLVAQSETLLAIEQLSVTKTKRGAEIRARVGDQACGVIEESWSMDEAGRFVRHAERLVAECGKERGRG